MTVSLEHDCLVMNSPAFQWRSACVQKEILIIIKLGIMIDLDLQHIALYLGARLEQEIRTVLTRVIDKIGLRNNWIQNVCC